LRELRQTVEVGALAVVVTTEGDPLSLRAGPGRGYDVLAALAQGTALTVLDGPATDAEGIAWYEVQAGALVGWCAAEFLAPAAPEPLTFVVAGTDGDGARLRDGPALTGGIVLVIPEGAAVRVVGANRRGDDYEWTPVEYAGQLGWVAAQFLGQGGVGGGAVPGATMPSEAAPAPAPAPQPAPAPPPVAPPPAPVMETLDAGDRAAVVDTEGLDLRIRAGVGLDAPIFDYVPAGAVVQVTGPPRPDAGGAPWYPIDYNGIRGWVLGAHLAATSAPPSQRPEVPPAERAHRVAEVALKYLGAPYLWGGTTPAGWDCSGFILYVYQEAAGITLPRTSQAQYMVGRAIPVEAIQAGDLVFFADVSGPGITHNGIALGDGRFIHARSERYGTVITSLADPYWAGHFAGARRP
jgi:cell wall-associated NlpC family hydrolase